MGLVHESTINFDSFVYFNSIPLSLHKSQLPRVHAWARDIPIESFNIGIGIGIG